ncbi:thiamine diphosphokinase [Thomasclavelia sp.]
MKIGVCSALAEELDSSLDYIGVDRGVEILINQGIKPIYAIGDFDSIKNENLLVQLEIERLPTRKDITDSHAAIDYAISKGYDEIDVYGVTGGRLDHFFSAMCLLEKYQNVKIRIINRQNIIELLKPGNHKIAQAGYKYFSLFALDNSYIDIENAQYPLNNYYLRREDPLCVSNQTIGEYSYVRNSRAVILVRSNDLK